MYKVIKQFSSVSLLIFMVSPIFTQAPVNDECATATLLQVNADDTCNLVTPSTNVGATASPETSNGLFQVPNNDVWFKFTALQTEHFISLFNIVPVGDHSNKNMYMGLYDATNGCGVNINPHSTSVPHNYTALGLTVGVEYHLRVFGSQFDFFEWAEMTFDVCISDTPMPPSNDLCANAEALPAIPTDGTCINVVGTTVVATNGVYSASCESVGFPDDALDVFYTFTASSSALLFEEVSADNHMRMVVLDQCPDGTETEFGPCGFFPVVVDGLTIGNTYTLRAWNSFGGPGGGQGGGEFEFSVKNLPAPNCASNAVANPDVGCSSLNVYLDWDVVPESQGYLITVGTTPGGNDIEDASYVASNCYELLSTIPGTTYYWTVTPTNSIGDATGCTENSFTTPVGVCYCPSKPTIIDDEGIGNVVLGTTTYTSSGTVTYDDYTGGIVEPLPSGALTNLMITFKTGFTYDVNVWIDFNDNLIFEASELMFDGESTNANPTVFDASFTMPTTAAVGVHHMRIGTADDGQEPPNPCFNGFYGVTLDFNVNIIGDCPTAYTISNGNKLTGTIDIIADYETDGSIESNQVIGGINSAISVDYDSGLDILLTSDFEVTAGAVFHAFIDGCGNAF